MQKGSIVAIFTAPAEGAPMESHSEIQAEEGRGIAGDRYYGNAGRHGPGVHATLIESEAIEAVARDYDISLKLHEPRRNIVTKGVSVNHLVGKEFQIGDAALRGVRLCEPCVTFEGRTQKGVIRAFIHRGGLRCEVIKSGAIRVGDTVELS